MKLALYSAITSRRGIFIFLLIAWLGITAGRIAATSNGEFPYWYDLGRDAAISRQIIENRDLKIQGPTASGTNDSVFHGVAYYYLIGPLYTLFGGDPRLVLMVIIGLSSLAVVPIFLLARQMSGKKSVAMLAVVLYAFSIEALRSGTWLSNPVIATVSLPFFYYLFYMVFFEDRKSWLPWLTLALGLTQQSVILYAPWWGMVALGFIINQKLNYSTAWKPKIILTGLGVYLLIVSSMIVAQTRVWLAGVFNPSSIIKFAAWSGSDVERIVGGTYRLFLLKIGSSLLPTLPLMSVIIFFGLVYFVVKKTPKKTQIMLGLILSSPLWLLSWHYRNMYHSFLTVELAMIIAFAWLLVYLFNDKTVRWLAVALLLVFVSSNVRMYDREHKAKTSVYFLPQGAYLSDLLNSIDYIYEQAGGDQFSISTITNPYGYNTLWSYLFGWYGDSRYGYKPSWYGPDQTGIPGGDLLIRTETPKAKHFSIWEPTEGIPSHLFAWFDAEQASISTSSATKYFGTVKVDKHF